MTTDIRRTPGRAAHRGTAPARPKLVLAVVLVAALAINVETTIVNVALPTLNSALGASTQGLQWIVDAYNLAFAALVLAGGTVGDKFGRRGTLIAGLVLFAVSSVGAALCTSTGSLIGMRVVMGIAAALIYPTTLAIITDTFRDPKQRAVAIGVWGAVTGLGVADRPDPRRRAAGGLLVGQPVPGSGADRSGRRDRRGAVRAAHRSPCRAHAWTAGACCCRS